MDDTELLTAALVVFAGVQVWLQHRIEITRKADREAEQDRAADIIWQIGWAEHFRLERLSNAWAQEDLVHESALGVLQAEDVLPRDWATLVRALAELGIEAGHLGALAMTLSHDLARDVAKLNALVNAARATLALGADPTVVAARARAIHGDELRPLIAGIRKSVRELSLLIWDALQHSPRASVVRELEFRDDMESEMGRASAKEIGSRGKRLKTKSQPLPRTPGFGTYVLRLWRRAVRILRLRSNSESYD